MKIKKNRLLAFSALLILTLGSAGRGAGQVPVPKGTVAFVRWGLQPGISQIYSMSSDGTHLTQLTHALPGIDVRYPCWSSDGSRLVFVVQNGSTFTLAVMLADGSQATSLATSNEVINRPVWSPDGRWIAFGMGMGIYLLDMNARRRLPQLLYSGSGIYASRPAWRPDSQRLSFTCASFGTNMGDIYSINLDGTGLKNLTQTPGIHESSPAWRPDGLSIAYVQSVFPSYGGDPTGEIYLMDTEGANRRPAANPGVICTGAPTWTHGGDTIIYSRRIFKGYDKLFATILSEGITITLTEDVGDDSTPTWKR